ncbi:MAG TPA: hypothetical protein VD886_02565 [Herpetosiphonaceae bacterium]|nr:hypothetical protein [Herpetosiphonaceae bacterium]
MTMIDPVAADRLERSRRRAILILSAALGLAGLFCAFMSVNIINPPARLAELGNVSQFPSGETVALSIPKLKVSDNIQNRPVASEDPLYVTRRADGTWRAILAWDSQTGCIVQPNEAGTEFTDTCSGHIYDADGYLTSEPTRLRLGSLPVVVEGDQVRVRDEFLPDARPR